MKKVLTVLLFFNIYVFAQTDWERWDAVEVSYQFGNQVKNYDERDHSNPGFILSVLKGTYTFFISDLDGDNCPFSPSCSNFFIQSVQNTNIIKGALMFSDRFVRDSNLFKSREQYKYIVHKRLYDPVDNYLLKTETVKFRFEK